MTPLHRPPGNSTPARRLPDRQTIRRGPVGRQHTGALRCRRQHPSGRLHGANVSPDTSISTATSLVRDLAARQNGLPALFADLEAFTATHDSAIPKPVTTAIGNLLAARLDLETGVAPDANDIQTALLQAGLDDASANAPELRNGPVTAAVLTTLRQSLQTWLAAETDPLEQLSTHGTVTAQRNRPRDTAAAFTAAVRPPLKRLLLVHRRYVTLASVRYICCNKPMPRLRERRCCRLCLAGDRAAVEQTRAQQPVTVLLEIPLATNEAPRLQTGISRCQTAE